MALYLFQNDSDLVLMALIQFQYGYDGSVAVNANGLEILG